MLHNRFYYALLLAGSTFALFFVYILQYKYGVRPCILCVYERIPFAFIAVVVTLNFVTKQHYYLLFNWIIMLSLLALAFLSWYHLGIERGYISETCSITSGLVPCSQAQFKILGYSLVQWNVAISSFGAFLHGCFLATDRHY